MYHNYFRSHPEVGRLTLHREGAKNRFYVPGNGAGRGAISGVTIGVGVEVRHQNRAALATALGASSALTHYLHAVPAHTGVTAHEWVTSHPGPVLTDAQVVATYAFAEPGYARMARDRLTGASAHHAADAGVRLSAQAYAALHPRVRELLTDIAWNARQMADGRQNQIAAALQSGLALQHANDASRACHQLRQLGVFISALAAQGADGRLRRLAWIDVRLEELQPAAPAALRLP